MSVVENWIHNLVDESTSNQLDQPSFMCYNLKVRVSKASIYTYLIIKKKTDLN